MKIDGNRKEKNAMKAFRLGNTVEGHMLQDEFVAEVRESLKTKTIVLAQQIANITESV